MRRRGPRRGLSLMEVIVSMALFGLISSCIGVMIRTGLQYMREGDARAELQRTSLFVLGEINREVAESHEDGIRLADPGGPAGFVYASPRGADGVSYIDNRLAWKAVVGIYWDSSSGLLFKARELLTPPTTFVPDLSPQGLDKSVDHFRGLSSQAKKVIGRNVSFFEATYVGQLKLKLEVSVKEGSLTSKLLTETGVTPGH